MHETEKERLNRNFEQLLQELRVAIPGVQVLFAFLLVAPFSTRFDLADQFERVVYFVALLFAALSAVLLLAPSIQHRILFRQDEKAYLVSAGTMLSIAGLTALACSIDPGRRPRRALPVRRLGGRDRGRPRIPLDTRRSGT